VIVLLLPYPSLTVIHPVAPPGLPSVPILELNCLFSDDDPGHVFSIEIANNKPISALQDAIKEMKQVALEYVDADALKLWDVSIADDDDFEENVSKFEFINEKALKPMTIFNQIFPKSPEVRHLHIIVRSLLLVSCACLVAVAILNYGAKLDHPETTHLLLNSHPKYITD
jgi:hypothetical protein